MPGNEERQPRKGSIVGKPPWVRAKRNVIRLPRTATRTATTEAPSPVPSWSHQPGDAEYVELLTSHTESRRETEYCRVRYPDADDYDLFDDEDHSQSSFGVPITPTPAWKRSCEERAETRAETELYSKRSRHGELPCLEFASAGFAEKTKNLLMTKDKLPLGKLGLAICQHDILADYHTFISCKMGDVRPDVEEGKRIAQTLSSVQQPSDLALRQLMNVVSDQSNMIVGLTAAVDSCMVRLTQLQKQLAEAVSSVVKKTPEAKLPEETCLAFENLTQLWRIPQLAVLWPDLSNAHFKSVDLNKKMQKWIRTKRGKPHDHVTACTDFFRVYLKEACEPPTLVKRYAVRISDSCAKHPELRDFPEELVEQLIGVCLDGHRLGMRELSCPVSVTALRRNPTPYVLILI
ncbi:unnamed protein product [Heligmosomoides polygyrus]|uniref:Uncharacterized protein n=1 Tax=Heligmosomoides polygyrus TaxID=6339 RepID=A0A183FTS1_HELPZ|nr:unnamed protein product [Heligmosomoides polygyrus]